MKTSIHRGFTLIELMIAVTIIGILVAVTLPAYQGYTLRAKVAEGLVMASALKLAISETHQSKGARNMSCTSAADCGDIGAAPASATANVAAITSTADGTIAIAYQTTALGPNNLLVLAPWDSLPAVPVAVALNAAPGAAPAALYWKCGYQATGSAPATTIPAMYLPATCR